MLTIVWSRICYWAIWNDHEYFNEATGTYKWPSRVRLLIVPYNQLKVNFMLNQLDSVIQGRPWLSFLKSNNWNQVHSSNWIILQNDRRDSSRREPLFSIKQCVYKKYSRMIEILWGDSKSSPISGTFTSATLPQS
jgi:hypothetical protein